MIICVLSDTHTDSIDRLPRKLLDQLSAVDLIIHAGDFTDKKLLDELRRIGTFRGVHGNLDSPEVKSELPAIENVEEHGLRIGVNHPAEGGSPFNLEDRLRPKFKDVQVIIYGHSHRAKAETKQGVLFLNPGSATGTFPATRKTYGILRLDKEPRAEIIKL